MGPYAWKIFLVLSVLTMTLGNVLALWQENVRRLLAYSSIANAGYMLIGLAVGLAPGTASGFWDGMGAMFFYLCVYAAATLGTFAVLAYLGRAAAADRNRRGTGRLGPHPPRHGRRVGRLHVQPCRPAARRGTVGQADALRQRLERRRRRRRSLRPWFIALAIIGVLNAAVAAYYYLRIVSLMYFREPLATPRAEGGPGAYVAALAVRPGRAGVGLLSRAADERVQRGRGGSEERGVERRTRTAGRGAGSWGRHG